MSDLNELMKLHDKATAGPWRVFWTEVCFTEERTKKLADCRGSDVGIDQQLNNVVYIVAACNSIPDLIHRIRELDDEVESLRDALEESESRQRSPLTDEEWAWIVRNA